MQTLADIVIENLRAIGLPQHPIYEEVLTHAVITAPPPFAENWFGRRYFELARSAEWFANSLIANAALEGYGSTQIWKFSNKVDNDAYAAAVRKHSLDESRHSTIFVTMLKLVFPGAHIDTDTAKNIDDLQPHYSAKSHPPIEKAPEGQLYRGERLLHELIQVHITEIRALVLQHLLRPTLLAYSPSSARNRLDALSRSLIRDESRHIEYTAEIFESEAAGGCKDFIFASFESCMREFNDLTMIELEREKVTI
jgi:hypothetical protein